MSQLNERLPSSFSRSSTGRNFGPVTPYPRRPAPQISALLIDPTEQTIRTVYLRPTAAGLRTIFGQDRVTFTDKPFFRAYGTDQYHDKITDRATLPGARFSVQGKVLVTGPKFTEIIPDVSREIMKHTTFCRCDAFLPSPLERGQG